MLKLRVKHATRSKKNGREWTGVDMSGRGNVSVVGVVEECRREGGGTLQKTPRCHAGLGWVVGVTG